MNRRKAASLVLAFLTAAVAAAPATAAGPPRHLLSVRYVSQRAEKAYMREGPSYAHRVLWVYRHRGTPFAVTASFDIWRHVRAADGTTGWMSSSMLSERRTVVVTGKGRAELHAAGGRLVGLAEPGAVANLKACAPTACEISSAGIDGWIAKSRIWGVEPNEVFR